MHAPLQGDICAYAVIGHEMMYGRELYSDLWERKPPLLYLTYAGAEAIAGYAPAEVFLLGTTFSLGTLVLIYFIGSSGNRGRFGGIPAALLWTLLNTDLQLTANQPDPEVFINFWLCGALLLMLRRPSPRWWTPVALGLLLAGATLYKHNAACAIAGLLAAYLITPQRNGLKRRFADCLVAGGVICLVWSALLAYFAAHHRADAFIDVLFRENVAYSRGLTGNIGRAITSRHLFPPWMVWTFSPLALLIVLGLFSIRHGRIKPSRDWILLAGLAVGVWVTIAVTGYLSSHYYQLWLPVGCIAGGWATGELIDVRRKIPGVFGWSTVVLAFSFLLIRQGRDFLLTPTEWVAEQYPAYNMVELNQLGVEIGRLLKNDECFWEFGDDNALYFFSHHSPPSGLLFIDPYLYGPRTQAYWSRLMGDLKRRQPALIVMSDNYTMLFASSAPIFPWLEQNYVVWNTPLGMGYHHLLIHRGSDLARRLGIE